ncbi:MAG: hypothetical protein V4476_07340 [Pseudomonadota bacterium]
MNPRIQELLDRIRQIEEELEREVKRRRGELNADFEQRRVFFAREIKQQQRRFKTGLLTYVLHAEWRHLVSAPFVYAVIIPLLLLDLFVSLYQRVCFPLYRIARVRRRDYLVYDRGALAYLNLLEKLNCLYCSYANGLVAYVREVVARTEQYWCPIKHARRTLQPHERYHGFVDYGNAAAYRAELQALRAELAALDSESR